MKKSNDFLKTLILLIAMACATGTIWAQGLTAMATLDEQAAAPVPRSSQQRMSLRVGDVNGDGNVAINDVTELIDALLNGSSVPNGDVNQDGLLNISDVTVLIDMLLNGTAPYGLTDAMNQLNEIYRSMRTAGWSTIGNTHQCFGIMAYNLTAEVMGDDMIMGASGSGWFFYDASYNVKSYYTRTSWRSYDLWNAYYTWIANANYLLETTKLMTGSEANYVKGQAYAIRAYSYFMLAQWFARTYKGHENEPCVPLFNKTTFGGSTGGSRATVAQVYAQIDADLAQAVSLLNGTTQQVPDHIGYAVALGLQARVALVKEDWTAAYEAANQAISASGKAIQEVSAFSGLNDASAGNVMWGAVIPDEESGQYASFFAHMDVSDGSNTTYAMGAPKQITKWLYDKMSATDARRAWWDPSSTYSTGGYVSQKFKMREGTFGAGDYIYMRVEEMYLIAAEAACRQNQTAMAKANLTSLMQKRDPNYSYTKTGSALGALTTDETGSLLEEILIQRRLELWGEDGRIMTIRRLHQGFGRAAEYGWPLSLQLSSKALYNPESYAWVLTLPGAEFTGNPNMNPEFLPVGDQNPLGDVIGTGQNLSFDAASSSITTARTSLTYKVPVSRQSAVGEYATTVNVNAGDKSTTVTVTFPDGVTNTNVAINLDDLLLGQTYSGTVSLSAYDEACHTGGSHISSHTYTIHCQNGDPVGQNITFETPSATYSASSPYLGVHVVLTRAKTDDEYTATISISDVQGNVELTDAHVFFAVGANRASTYLYFNDMEVDQSYSCVLTLSPADAATGGEFTTMQITVNRENWVTLGTAYYTTGLFSDEQIATTVQQVQGSNTYKLLKPFSNEYDIIFTIDGSNKVYIQSQPVYNDVGNYGIISMVGYANADDSGYAGTYDPSTKTANLTIRYYCDAGYFPVFNDVLVMP